MTQSSKAMLVVWALLTMFASAGDCNSVPDAFSLTVPDAPILAPLGASITLPCSVSPPFNVVPFTVRWHRLNQSPKRLLFYKSGQMQEVPADPQYKGRVSLVGQLDKGNASMKLEKLTLSDGGVYVCIVEHQRWLEDANVILNVKVVGTLPVLSVTSGEGKQVNITCVSDGWSPSPTVTWRKGGGEEISAQKTDYTTDEQGLVRVSSWLLHSPSESEWLSCSVGLSDQERREGRVVPYVHTSHKGAVIGGAISVLIVLILVPIIIILYRKGVKKNKKIKEKEDTIEENNKAIKTKDDTIGLLKKTETNLEKRLKDKTSEAETLQKQKEGLEKRLKDKTSEAEKLQQQNEDLEKRLKDKTREAETLQTQKEGLNTELKKARDEVQKLNKELAKVREELKKHEKD